METPIATASLVMGSLPARHARYRPHHTAVVIAPRGREEHEIRLTWREFDTYVNRCANVLASLGVARGDRVATVLPNSLVLLATYWACAKLGAAVVPLSPLLNATGLASLLADATPSVVIGCERPAGDAGRGARPQRAARRRHGCCMTPRPATSAPATWRSVRCWPGRAKPNRASSSSRAICGR